MPGNVHVQKIGRSGGLGALPPEAPVGDREKRDQQQAHHDPQAEGAHDSTVSRECERSHA